MKRKERLHEAASCGVGAFDAGDPACFRTAATPLLTAGDRTELQHHDHRLVPVWAALWNLPVCTVYVRPERYTYQFMESHDYFTVSVLPEEAKK